MIPKKPKKKKSEESNESKLFLLFTSLMIGLLTSIFITAGLFFASISKIYIAAAFFPIWTIITIGSYYLFYPK